MRIPLTRVWRAFPELDRFTDEQCERFVRAACKQDWRRFVHRGGLGCLTIVLFVVLFWVMMNIVEHFDPWLYQRRFAGGLALFAGLLLSLGFPAAVAIVVRHRLLLRRIRFVLSARGCCPSCRYSLLGLVVTGGNLVVCPECGMEVEVDESLSELTTDTQGRELFTPSERVEELVFWTPKRRRRCKRVAKVLAVLVFVVLPAGWGVYEVFLWRQAKTAQAERPDVAGVLAFVESHQEPGTTPADVNAFDVLAEVDVLMTEIAEKVTGQPEWIDPETGHELRPEFSMIYAPPLDAETEERWRDMWMSPELAMALLEAYREGGAIEKLDSLASARRAVRPLVALPDQPVVSIPLRDLGRAREYARINAARMHLALEAGDRDEFLKAFETTLALARVYHHQASLMDARAADAIEMLALDRARHVLATHPDGAWLDGIESAMARQRSQVPRTHAIEGERLIGLDAVAWFFSSSTRTRWGRFSPELDALLGGLVSEDYRKRLGTYAGNRARLSRYYDAHAEAVGVDAFERPALPTFLDGRLLLDTMLSYLKRTIINGDRHEAVRRGTVTMLALERSFLAHGSYPASLEPLVPGFLGMLPVDPWSGEPLRYRLTPGEGVGYVLYSVGPDGTDDGGQRTKRENGRVFLNPDFILSPQAD